MKKFIFDILLAGALLVVLPGAAPAQQGLEPLAFLLGEWEASGGGAPGQATGSATFSSELQGRVMVRRSFADYPATETAPATRHEDLMIIRVEGDGSLAAEFYDSEGHVIHYAVTVPGDGEASFVSEAGGGPRFRLGYKLAADGVLQGVFEIAPPGNPESFNRYLAWDSHRVISH